MSLRDEMGSEALRGAQRKKKKWVQKLGEEHNEKKKEMGSEAWTGARQVGVKKNE